MNCSVPEESGNVDVTGRLPSMQMLTMHHVRLSTFYVSSTFSRLSRQHFMELSLGNVENEKVMCTIFFSLSESLAIYY